MGERLVHEEGHAVNIRHQMVTDRDQTPRQTAKIAPWGGHFYTGNKGLGDELIPPLTSLKISYCTTHVDPHRYQ